VDKQVKDLLKILEGKGRETLEGEGRNRVGMELLTLCEYFWSRTNDNTYE